jgi:hypothetical protein
VCADAGDYAHTKLERATQRAAVSDANSFAIADANSDAIANADGDADADTYAVSRATDGDANTDTAYSNPDW